MRTRYLALAAAVMFAAACEDGAATTGSGSPSASTTAVASAPATASATAKAEVPKGKIFFIAPLDGAQTFPEVDVVFGAAGRRLVEKDGDEHADWPHGHAAVVIDGEPVAAGEAFPKDDTHVLFEDAERGEVKLEPGKHKLTVQFVDHDGKATDLQQTIEIEVVEGKGERKVEILEPKDGAKVKEKFTVKFGVEGIDIRPAGEAPKDKITGHHHLLIDMGSMPTGVEIPNDKTHLHYGKGQTEAEIELPKGKHKITAQFADGAHLSYGEKLSHSIEIEVE